MTPLLQMSKWKHRVIIKIKMLLIRIKCLTAKFFLKKLTQWDFTGGPVVGWDSASNAGNMGLILIWGARIPHATRCGQKFKNKAKSHPVPGLAWAHYMYDIIESVSCLVVSTGVGSPSLLQGIFPTQGSNQNFKSWEFIILSPFSAKGNWDWERIDLPKITES